MRDKVTVLAGKYPVDGGKPRRVFDSIVLAFLEDVFTEIKHNKQTRKSTEDMSFGFWCRRRQVEQWKKEYRENQIGRGLIFHITPSNIPNLFAYSLVFGMLSGNQNIVRVSSRLGREIEPLCQVFNAVFSKEKYKELQQENAIISYEHDEEITKAISLQSDGRVIWGGDETVNMMRKIPMSIQGVELAFANRTSMAVLQSEWMETLSDEELSQLARRFYNDTYQVDQNACSSPSTIVWVGEPTDRERWWKMVAQVAKEYDLTAWKVSKKYEDISFLAMSGTIKGKLKTYGNSLYVISCEKQPEIMESLQGRFGCFYEFTCETIQEIGDYVPRKIQTILYAGINPGNLQEMLLTTGRKGGDRIVPIGQALTLTPIWDGMDVIGNLSRTIYLQS